MPLDLGVWTRYSAARARPVPERSRAEGLDPSRTMVNRQTIIALECCWTEDLGEVVTL